MFMSAQPKISTVERQEDAIAGCRYPPGPNPVDHVMHSALTSI